MLIAPLLPETLGTEIQKEIREELPFVFWLEVEAVMDDNEPVVGEVGNLDDGPYFSKCGFARLFINLMLMELPQDVRGGWVEAPV